MSRLQEIGRRKTELRIRAEVERNRVAELWRGLARPALGVPTAARSGLGRLVKHPWLLGGLLVALLARRRASSLVTLLRRGWYAWNLYRVFASLVRP